MGAQRILQAAVGVALIAIAVAPPSVARADGRERVAVIDLGPADTGGDASVRRGLLAAVVAAGFAPVIGDGVEDALAGASADSDAIAVAGALAQAQAAFGALDCAATATAARTAVGIASARQAAKLPAPELGRAWTLILLCADRTADADGAQLAARRLRALGGSTDVPAEVWRKYPEVDAVLDRELLAVDIVADVAGAEIWIDGVRAGVSPLRTQVLAGDHVIAAAAGDRRGWAAGTAVKSQPRIAVPMARVTGAAGAIAARVTSWRGALPSAAELGWVLAQVNARIAVVRRGDQLEVWGRPGLAEPVRLLGGDDGRGPVADVARLLAVATDRIAAWTSRAPDPDQPLLREIGGARLERGDAGGGEGDGDSERNPATKWWIYAAIGGAVATGLAVIYLHDAGSDRQRVEVHIR